MTRLTKLFIALRSSLWFVPTLIVIGSAVLAESLIEIDRISDRLLADFPRLFGAGAEGSRGMLSSIASSMITVAGVTFSITIVALSQASSQFSSRILRNFMRDRANQVVLGIFLGVFTYCLLVLRAIRGGDEGIFVPSLSIFGGLVLALMAIGFLIFFIHHAAALLQASNVIAGASAETRKTIDRLYPEILHGIEPELNAEAEIPDSLAQRSQIVIPAPVSGYIQGYDEATLTRLAASHNVVLRMHSGVGEFAISDTPLLSVYSHTPLNMKLVRNIQSAYSISTSRTTEQDPGFGIRQIVDIALKALSPGVNDTTTALTCIDHLTAINVKLANRRIARPVITENGELRIILKGPDFETFTEESFNEIRTNARGNAVVIARLLRSLQSIAAMTDNQTRKILLRKHMSLLIELAEETVDSDYDRARIREVYLDQPS